MSSKSVKASVLFSRKSLTSQIFLGAERKKYIIFEFYMCNIRNIRKVISGIDKNTL